MACGRCNSIEVRCDKTLAAASSHKSGDTQGGAFRADFWIVVGVVIGYPCVALLSRAARMLRLFGICSRLPSNSGSIQGPHCRPAEARRGGAAVHNCEADTVHRYQSSMFFSQADAGSNVSRRQVRSAWTRARCERLCGICARIQNWGMRNAFRRRTSCPRSRAVLAM